MNNVCTNSAFNVKKPKLMEGIITDIEGIVKTTPKMLNIIANTKLNRDIEGQVSKGVDFSLSFSFLLFDFSISFLRDMAILLASEGLIDFSVTSFSSIVSYSFSMFGEVEFSSIFSSIFILITEITGQPYC